MRAVLKRIGKAVSLAIADNIVTVPVAAAVVGNFHLTTYAPAISWTINNGPFYGGKWIGKSREAFRNRRDCEDSRFVGGA